MSLEVKDQLWNAQHIRALVDHKSIWIKPVQSISFQSIDSVDSPLDIGLSVETVLMLCYLNFKFSFKNFDSNLHS